jgi:K+:H+ antiporter
MSLTSTVITVRVLEELNMISDTSSTLILGISIVEDITAISAPIRDLFAAVFFISIGALMDVSLIPAFIIPALLLILTSFSSKFMIVVTLLNRAKYDNITSLSMIILHP